MRWYKNIIELLEQILKELKEMKENPIFNKDAKMKDYLILKNNIAQSENLEELYAVIDGTIIKIERLVNGIEEPITKEDFHRVKGRALNTVNGKISREASRIFKIKEKTVKSKNKYTNTQEEQL